MYRFKEEFQDTQKCPLNKPELCENEIAKLKGMISESETNLSKWKKEVKALEEELKQYRHNEVKNLKKGDVFIEYVGYDNTFSNDIFRVYEIRAVDYVLDSKDYTTFEIKTKCYAIEYIDGYFRSRVFDVKFTKENLFADVNVILKAEHNYKNKLNEFKKYVLEPASFLLSEWNDTLQKMEEEQKQKVKSLFSNTSTCYR